MAYYNYEGQIEYSWSGAPSGGTLWVSDPIGTYNTKWTGGSPARQSVYGSTIPFDAMVWTLTYYEWTHDDVNDTFSTTINFNSQYPFDEQDINSPTSAISTRTTKYKFKGWKDSNGNLYENGDRITVKASGEYLIAYVSISTSTSKSFSYSSITLPTPGKSHAGYTFLDWYGFNGKESKSYKVGDSVTIYGWQGDSSSESKTYFMNFSARWTANKYKITFDPGEGTCSTVSRDVYYDSTYGTLPTAKLNGHTFIGWFDDRGNQYLSTDKVKITSDTTLYAHYSDALPINISYNLDGGQFKSGIRPVESFTIDFSDFVLFGNDNEKPYKNGYVFIGWAASSKEWAKLGLDHEDDDYVISFTIRPKTLEYWNMTAHLTANWAKLGKFYKDGNWRPIMATWHKSNGNWKKIEDVSDPNIGTGKIRTKVAGSWKKEIGSK